MEESDLQTHTITYSNFSDIEHFQETIFDTTYSIEVSKLINDHRLFNSFRYTRYTILDNIDDILQKVMRKDDIVLSNSDGFFIYNNDPYYSYAIMVSDYRMVEDKDGVQYYIFYITAASNDIDSLDDVIYFINDIPEFQEKSPSTSLDDVPQIDIHFGFKLDGRTQSIQKREDLVYTIHPEGYPYIKDMETYVDDYLKGDEPILILGGTPGTGKTMFLRYIFQRYCINNEFDIPDVYTSSDPEILNESTYFMQFAHNEDAKFMVIEDVSYDTKEMFRNKGNSNICTLLFLGDGLMNMSDRKIIITTNSMDFDHIDDALTRSGRCYDVLKFDKLKNHQATNLLKKINPEITREYARESDITLADLYNIVRNYNKKRVGRED